MRVFKHEEKDTNPWTFSLYIGFFAGLIWGGFKVLFYYLDFTRVVPGFMIEAFFRHRFLMAIMGSMIGWGSFIVFSIIAAFIYTVGFRKREGPWPGVIYGIAWWALWFIVIGPTSGIVKSVNRLDTNSLVSEFCIFLLWGLFIGYSVSEEFAELRHEPAEG